MVPKQHPGHVMIDVWPQTGQLKALAWLEQHSACSVAQAVPARQYQH